MYFVLNILKNCLSLWHHASSRSSRKAFKESVYSHRIHPLYTTHPRSFRTDSVRWHHRKRAKGMLCSPNPIPRPDSARLRSLSQCSARSRSARLSAARRPCMATRPHQSVAKTGVDRVPRVCTEQTVSSSSPSVVRPPCARPSVDSSENAAPVFVFEFICCVCVLFGQLLTLVVNP